MEKIQTLYQLYRPDFEIFGYSPPSELLRHTWQFLPEEKQLEATLVAAFYTIHTCKYTSRLSSFESRSKKIFYNNDYCPIYHPSVIILVCSLHVTQLITCVVCKPFYPCNVDLTYFTYILVSFCFVMVGHIKKIMRYGKFFGLLVGGGLKLCFKTEGSSVFYAYL